MTPYPLTVNHSHSDARETLPTARNGPKGVAAPITLLAIARMYESVRR